jgi:hypothetical protein
VEIEDSWNPAGDMCATGGTLLLSLSCKRRTGYPR